MNGTISRILNDRKFGFIKNHLGEEYFFHKDDFLGFWTDLEIDIGNRYEVKVTFISSKTPKGLRAREVKREDWPN